MHGDHFVPSAVGEERHGHLVPHQLHRQQRRQRAGERVEWRRDLPLRGRHAGAHLHLRRARSTASGRRRWARVGCSCSLSRTGLHYETLRGCTLDAVRLAFTHSNVGLPQGCDAIFGGDCSIYGIPDFENEVIDFTLGLDVNVDVTAFAAHLWRDRPDRSSGWSCRW